MATPGGIRPKGKHGLVDLDIPGANKPCAYCKRPMMPWSVTHPTKDHTIPKSRGGLETILACFQCNQLKSDMMPEDWSRVMRENPGWWEIPGLGARIRNALRKDNGVCPVMVVIVEEFMRIRYGVWKPRGSPGAGQPPIT